jgi:uncharacterized protein (TIGR02118 family)
MQYYVNQHMPLAMKIWGPAGLRGWQVTAFETDPATSQSYCTGSVFTWDDAAAANRALAMREAAALFEDIPNFTNVTPLVMIGQVTDSWTGH